MKVLCGVGIFLATIIVSAQEQARDTSGGSAPEPPSTETISLPQPEPVPPVTVVAEEEQVAFDEAGTVLVLDANLRTRYGLFPDIVGFRQALLFKKGDAYELALTADEGDRRVPLSAEQVAAIRGKIAKIDAAAKPAEPPILVPVDETKLAAPSPLPKKRPLYDESAGFAPFLTYTTLYAGLYGLSFPFVFGGSDAHWALYPGIGFLSAGTAFGLGYYLGRDAEMTRGMALGAGEGGWRGAIDGMLLWWLVAGSIRVVEYEDGSKKKKTDIGINDVETYFRLFFASSVLVSMAEYGLGMWYGKWSGATGGQMRMLGLGSNFGYLTMLELLSTSLNEDFISDNRGIERLIPACMLAGGVGGLFLGHALNGLDRYTEGDASLFYTGLALGTYLPVSILVTARAEEWRLYTGLMIPGTIGGAVASYFLLKGLDFSDLDAFLFDLGVLAGGLTTTGIGYIAIAAAKVDNGGSWLASLSSIGLFSGYAVMYVLFRDKGLRQAAQEDSRLGWRFHLNPAGIVTALVRPPAASPRSEEDIRILRETPAAPIVSLEYRW